VASTAFGLGVAVSRLAAAVGVVGLLAAHFAAVALAVGALTGRRATAIAAASGLGISGFVWNGLAPLTDALAPWRRLSPFAWAFDNDPLAGSTSVGGIALLTGAIVLWLAIAVIAFERRDLGT
jgi:ABC-2 type transport system permease protein